MKETTMGKAQASLSDQCCSVRPEARAREFVHVARLSLFRAKSEGNQKRAPGQSGEAWHVNRVPSHEYQTRSLEIHPWGD